MLDLLSRVKLAPPANHLQVIGLLHRRVEIGRKALAVLGQLHALTRERLENRTAGIRGELEAAAAVELVHRPQKGHVALAD